jgi:hypothetical protein
MKSARSGSKQRATILVLAFATAVAGTARAKDTSPVSPLVSYRVVLSGGKLRHNWEAARCNTQIATSVTTGWAGSTGVLIVRYPGVIDPSTKPPPADGAFYPVTGSDSSYFTGGRVMRMGCAGETSSPPTGCHGRDRYIEDSPATGTWTYVAFPWRCNTVDTNSTSFGDCETDSSGTRVKYANRTAGNYMYATVIVPAQTDQDWAHASTSATLGQPAHYVGLGTILPGARGVMGLTELGTDVWGPTSRDAYPTPTSFNNWPVVGTLNGGSRVIFGVDWGTNVLYAVNARSGDVLWTSADSGFTACAPGASVGEHQPDGGVLNPTEPAGVTGTPALLLMKHGSGLTQDVLFIGTRAGSSSKVISMAVSASSCAKLGEYASQGDVSGIGVDYATKQIYFSAGTGVSTKSLYCIAGLHTGTGTPCAGWGVDGIWVGPQVVPPILKDGYIWTGNTSGGIYKVSYASPGTPSPLATVAGGLLTRVWAESRSSTTAFNRVYVRTLGELLGLNKNTGAVEFRADITSPTSGPVVNGPDGYLLAGAADGHLYRFPLTGGTGSPVSKTVYDARFQVCPGACSVGEPQLLFPTPTVGDTTSGATRAVVGSSAGNSGRFRVSSPDGDSDHDGSKDPASGGSDNCTWVYNPNQSADACTVYDLHLDGTATNTLTSSFWYKGHRNCNTSGNDLQLYTNDRCGTKSSPISMAQSFVFGAGGGTNPTHAKVTWADGDTVGTKGGIKVALTNLTPASGFPVIACGDYDDTCGTACIPGCTDLKLGFKYIHFHSLTLRTDDSSIGYTGVSPRYLDSDGTPSADRASVLAGPWFIDAVIEVRHLEPASNGCGATTSIFSEFKSGGLTANPNDHRWGGPCSANSGTGIYGCYSDTGGKHKLDIYLNLPDIIIDAVTCSYNSNLGGVWMDVGLSNFKGQLHFTD